MSTESESNRFIRIISLALSALTGALIVFPLLPQLPGAAAFAAPIIGAFAGYRIGLKRAGTRLYLYFVALSALILMTLLVSAFAPPISAP